jgi:hypothetical protein
VTDLAKGRSPRLLEQRERRRRHEDKVVDALREFMAEGHLFVGQKKLALLLDMREDEFRRIAAEFPRYPLPQARGQGLRPRYRYYLPEIIECMLKR